MVNRKKQLKIVAPVGDVPSKDKHLSNRIEKLPSDADISEVFKEIDEWEKIAVKKFRKLEQTDKSGRLGLHC